ncbi:DUF6883 domain-containing protein [Sphingomonas bacterium]|uniref:DUF6883 domain-containing protein n=1 Tax=Sphingomonas bacterium TaxID=1895847 RepID=UPI001574FF64|nr:DUF6883 domain-containing protein [Sphingomonas bacterium]
MNKLVGDRFVLRRKVENYLLQLTHLDGGSKARFFMAHGFSADDPDRLIAALSAHPDDNPVVAVRESQHGVTSVIRCRLRSPDGRDPCVQTIWMLDKGGSIHRFVTAYPSRD